MIPEYLALRAIIYSASFGTLIVMGATGASAQSTTQPAQASIAPPAPDLNADRIIVGVGVASVPSYEGSDNNNFIFAAAVQGQYKGYAFNTRGTQLFVDVIRNQPGQSLDFQLGPVISVNTNRRTRSGIDDRQVEALGTRKIALELGGFVGVGKTGLITSAYDTLSVKVAYIHDVTGVHSSYVVTPIVNYGTPLSRKAYVGLSASASYAGRGYARTYFNVDPAGSLRSGLPIFYADKGWKNYSLSALGTYSLTGDLTGGLSAVGGISYSRLLNDFADSPITSIAGSRNQWFYALGLAYTF